jgi:hypothetical protein
MKVINIETARNRLKARQEKERLSYGNFQAESIEDFLKSILLKPYKRIFPESTKARIKTLE